jgi:hypothetical protein
LLMVAVGRTTAAALRPVVRCLTDAFVAAELILTCASIT